MNLSQKWHVGPLNWRKSANWRKNPMSASRNRMFNLNCFRTKSDLNLISWKLWEQMKETGSTFHWPCSLKPKSKPLKMIQNGRGQWCLQSMADMKNLVECSNIIIYIKVKAFALQDYRSTGWLSIQTNTTDYMSQILHHLDETAKWRKSDNTTHPLL